MGTASFFSVTLLRKAMARWSFQPLIAWAVSLVFLKETRRYDPRARADLAEEISWAAYRTCHVAKVSHHGFRRGGFSSRVAAT